MGYFNKLEQEIMAMAHDMGDDFGEDAETIKIISRALEVNVEDVQRVLSDEYDADPREYADAAADEDAIHYGHA